MVRLTQDLTSSKWIYTKGFLLLLISLTSAALILIPVPRWDVCFLLLICLWASCRTYYFAFYVIQHYVDPDYRFSGLFDFSRYLLGRSRPRGSDKQSSTIDESP